MFLIQFVVWVLLSVWYFVLAALAPTL
jgi:hypothetical protein